MRLTLPSEDLRVNRRLSLGHAASSAPRTCQATRTIDFYKAYSSFLLSLSLSAARIKTAVCVLLGLLVSHVIGAFHTFIEDIIELLERLLLDTLVLTVIGLRNMLITIDHMVQLATVTYFYLYSRNIQSAFVLPGVEKGLSIINIHEIHVDVFIYAKL